MKSGDDPIELQVVQDVKQEQYVECNGGGGAESAATAEPSTIIKQPQSGISSPIDSFVRICTINKYSDNLSYASRHNRSRASVAMCIL